MYEGDQKWSQKSIALIIPIYNAAKDIPVLLPAIAQQKLKPDYILVIDSNSSDESQSLLTSYPELDIQIHTIKQSEFDHGGTRKLGNELVDADIYIYLTQDAIPATADTFQNLIRALESQDDIACVYGRQLPKGDATPVAAHARLFNYPEDSYVRTYADKDRFGIKTCFNSDSFAAYKGAALKQIGNFPLELMTGEDAYVAAKFLKNGYAIAYAADATVYHSHNLSFKEEFHRYFSIGVFHGREYWIIRDFNTATGEGLRFVKSELNYLIQRKKFHWIPKACMSTVIKYIAYQLGIHENKIPLFIKKRFGVNKSFWFKKRASNIA